MSQEGISYAVAQQSGSLTAAGIVGTSTATATTLMTTNKQRAMLAVTSSLNQPVIVTWQGAYLQYLAIGGAAVFDVATDGLYFEAGGVLGAYYVSASPTTGSLYAMAL